MQTETRDKLLTLLQYLVPQHLLSRLVGWLAASEEALIKKTFISHFVRRFDIDMREAIIEDPLAYKSFNDFFTRQLKADARPLLANRNSIGCPADGAISQIGDIHKEAIFQAKGHYFNLVELLGGDRERAEPFIGGKFATIYLSPRDYHRVHMPYRGTLREMVHVPGQLFSVNTRTAENVPGLFARNERVVAIFDTELGPMAVILVGAMIVASIETVWAGQVTPHRRQVRTTRYDASSRQPIVIEQGAEVGRFKLGSTAIVLLPKDTVEWDAAFQEGVATRMGTILGQCR